MFRFVGIQDQEGLGCQPCNFQPAFALSGEMGRIVLQVLGIFFGSKVSKYVHERPQAGGEPDTAGGQDNRYPQILELIRAKGYATRADVETALGASSRTASRLLAELERQGLIRTEGEGRGTRYLLREPGQGGLARIGEILARNGAYWRAMARLAGNLAMRMARLGSIRIGRCAGWPGR